MSELIDLKCRSCGAPLVEISPGRYKCEYCGSRYKKEGSDPCNRPNLLQTGDQRVHVLAVKVSVNYDTFRSVQKEHLLELIKKDMCMKVAEAIMPLLDIDENVDFEDALNMRRTYRGSIRIVDKGVSL